MSHKVLTYVMKEKGLWKGSLFYFRGYIVTIKKKLVSDNQFERIMVKGTSGPVNEEKKHEQDRESWKSSENTKGKIVVSI